MADLALSGRYVVVTRPAAQAEGLCDAIAARGGIAVRFPLLAIAPPRDESEMASATARLDDFDLAFFVSPNAVNHALAFIQARRGWPAKLAVATVGKGSERSLSGHGFANVFAPQSGFDSESVLALAEFQAAAIAGKRVLIFRGDGGRDLLGTTLRERGAEIEYATCYRRYCPEPDAQALLGMAREQQLDALTLTSSEAVPNLIRLLGMTGTGTLRDVPVFVPHPRIAQFARAAGFTRVFETAAGDAGLVRALEAYFSA